MIDEKNMRFVKQARNNDFVVSDLLTSCMLAQISENRVLNWFYEDLFDPYGSDVYLENAYNFVKLGEEVNFFTVVESARQKGEIAFGYRVKEEKYDPEKNYGLHINPNKREKHTYYKGDKILVICISEVDD